MVAANTGVKDQKYETPFTIEDRERGSQPRGVHHNGVIISMGLKAVLGQYELSTDRHTRDRLPWTIGNGDLKHEECITHRIPHA